jgi:hypothetical protein
LTVQQGYRKQIDIQERTLAVHIIKSVEVFSVAKIMAMIHACLGLVAAPFFLLIGLMGSALGERSGPVAGIFGVGFAILMPFLYGIAGFIAGLMFALLYNLFARWVGGIELELEMKPAIMTAPYPLVPPQTPVA